MDFKAQCDYDKDDFVAAFYSSEKADSSVILTRDDGRGLRKMVEDIESGRAFNVCLDIGMPWDKFAERVKSQLLGY